MGSSAEDVRIDPRVAELQISPTLAARAKIDALAREGKRVFRLGLGQSPFPVPDSVVAALRTNAAERDYLPVRGLPALREAVAEYLRRRYGIARSASDVIIGPGSKELLFLLQLCFDGDVLIPVPGWVSYAPQAHVCGRRVRYLPPSGGALKLTAEALEAGLCDLAPGRGLLMLNYPNNPTGSTYSPDELQRLATVCAKHRLVVLSDEIYGELDLHGTHSSFASFYPERTIVATGLSKWCGAGGWRLGAFAFPQELRHLADAMAAVGSETFSSTSAPIQHAAVAAFRGGVDIERYLVSARRIQALLCRWSAQTLRSAGLHVPEPCGGFYLFPDFEAYRPALAQLGIRSGAELVSRLLDDLGLSSVAGSDFGMPRSSLCIRLALVDFDGARAMAAESGQPVDEGFLREHAHQVVGAMEAIVGWLATTGDIP